MITQIRTLTIDQICERKNDLLLSVDDVIELAKNERAKAIDEFAVAIKVTLPSAVHIDCSEIDYEVDCALYSVRNRIDRIAEQMKGGVPK